MIHTLLSDSISDATKSLSHVSLRNVLGGSDTFGQRLANTNTLKSSGDKQVGTFQEEITPFGHKALALGSFPL